MNTLQIEIGQLSVVLNVGIRIATAVFFMAFLLPLLIKEAKVKNGLKTLRYELLITGGIIFLINTIGLGVIVFRYLNLDTIFITEFVTYFNSIGFLIYAIVKHRIYTQHYTPESKRLHARFEKLEESERSKHKKG